MRVSVVVGIDVMLYAPCDRLGKGLLPAIFHVPPITREPIAIILIPEVGKHGELKTEVRMIQRKLVNRADSAKP